MEWTSIVVALLSLLGTLVGTYAGIVSASKVTEWRIRQLESKISALETKVDKLTQQVNLIQGRMEALHSD
jgi:outer membrane murein-binding lipoprotein Lpp|nr:MAG TPA: Lipopolysaccharide assembly protein A domain [Caudoviricetes sp.]